ncbi:MAG: hypothetical protein AAF828_09170 [Bacteroidota bacterium]
MDKKQLIKVSRGLEGYLTKHGRMAKLPLEYDDLMRYSASHALLNFAGEDTYWETVYFDSYDQEQVNRGLRQIYALLRMDGDMEAIEHLEVARIDFCLFANTGPFRIRIINRLNDNYDHFYVKRADASRIYGLELEELLSPNSVLYLTDGNTLIEEHIAGIPGDDFFREKLEDTTFNQIRMAKEFVKFNERCFVRLLGDMRAYNYVIDITPDIEGSQFRFRAIDFDQQCYEGRKSFYLPQYFKENNPIIFLGIEHMSNETVIQYQVEERSLIASRVKTGRRRLSRLLSVMEVDKISLNKHVTQLKYELADHHKSASFERCVTMGEILKNHLALLLEKDFRQSMGGISFLVEGKG